MSSISMAEGKELRLGRRVERARGTEGNRERRRDGEGGAEQRRRGMLPQAGSSRFSVRDVPLETSP